MPDVRVARERETSETFGRSRCIAFTTFSGSHTATAGGSAPAGRLSRKAPTKRSQNSQPSETRVTNTRERIVKRDRNEVRHTGTRSRTRKWRDKDDDGQRVAVWREETNERWRHARAKNQESV